MIRLTNELDMSSNICMNSLADNTLLGYEILSFLFSFV